MVMVLVMVTGVMWCSGDGDGVGDGDDTHDDVDASCACGGVVDGDVCGW